MTGFELDEILKEYDISEKTLIDCVQEVIRVNPRINKSYQEVGFNWKDLSIFTIKRILESYNQSTINLRTREIVGYKENTEIKASYKGVFNVILTLTFNPKFEDGTTDVDMFALAKKHDGHFSTIYYNNIKEPGISLSDWRDFSISKELEISPDEIIKVNLKEVEEEVEQIIFFTYLYNETKPKNAFSSMKFILINEDDNLIYNMDITNEINNAIGVTGFEFIKKDNIWRIHVLGEDLKYDINKLLSTL